ncbi:Histidine--tRNA ligase [Tsuneonella dongtanensis]|uniref:Histidine--tRNA ligase n=1 Tax=Tsuneonella dongtanensis TaxID=692370 RepID=A0A1B2A9A0_9SPHN|nr:histidine--tRNA ligase [Tsuneonella dongtanensis]ANY18739.1 Histidine--tRNA ligase [Tsuneonella dongtanensis]
MSKTPQAIRGTQDIFGAEAEAFAFVVETFERVRKLYRFRRVEMPVFERTEVFSRAIGETTDVVSKEMYSFEDRGGESLTLRPEFTAGIARAFITDGWQQHAPLKIATHGPLFRYERPQKGRYRQFHQLDAEIIGAGEPQADVELLAMADQLLKELGIADGVTLHLNTLGDGDSREAWRSALVDYFRAVRGELSEDSQERLEKNPLRILDSKDPRDRAFVADAPKIDDFLSGEAQDFFGKVTAGLDAAGVAWERNPALVRGLDYYRHTAFEFVTDRLGAQGTVLGGGRYDGLMESLGGPPTPAVGWAAGIERLAMLVGEPPRHTYDHGSIVVVPVNEAATGAALQMLADLRRIQVPAEMAFKGNMKKRMQKAASSGATHAVFVDAERWASRQIEIRNLKTGKQTLIEEIEMDGLRPEQISDLARQVTEHLQMDDFEENPRGEDAWYGPYDLAERMFVPKP